MDDFKKALIQARDLWRKLKPGQRMGIIAAVVATVGIIAFVSLRGNTESYSLLYAGLAPDEAGRIVEQLKADKVAFRLTNAGTGIEVPEVKVHEVRLALAQKGLPKGGGIGYELFDKQSFGTTSFVEQMNYRRALQGELARTVMSLDEVESSRVHLAIPERSLYKQNDEPPSASVALKLKPGRKLLPGQVRGIVHIVSGSVEGLAPERVTVIDESGNVLSEANDAAGNLDSQQSLEKSLERRVREVVERLVGPGHVAVVITAEMDYAKTDRTEEQFDKDGVLRSEARTEERSGGGALDATGGIAGARGNLPGAPTPTSTATGPQGASKLSETKNYEVSRVVQHTINPVAKIKQLHVALLVDQAEKTPRTTEELARISALAREAAGLSKERGDSIEVHSATFATAPVEVEPTAAPPSTWPLPFPPLYAAVGAAGLFLIIVTVSGIFVLRARARKRRKAAEVLHALPVRVGELDGDALDAPASAAAPSLAAGSPAIAALNGKSPRERALEAAKSDAARAAQVLAAWLLEAPEGARNA